MKPIQPLLPNQKKAILDVIREEQRRRDILIKFMEYVAEWDSENSKSRDNAPESEKALQLFRELDLPDEFETKVVECGKAFKKIVNETYIGCISDYLQASAGVWKHLIELKARYRNE